MRLWLGFLVRSGVIGWDEELFSAVAAVLMSCHLVERPRQNRRLRRLSRLGWTVCRY